MRAHYLVLAVGLSATAACTHQAVPPVQTAAASAACYDIGDTSAAVGGLFSSGQVFAAEKAVEAVPVGRAGKMNKFQGGQFYVHAGPGMTSEYLQRTLECYTIYGKSDRPHDPFHPGVGTVADVKVRPAGNSFQVRVVGSTPEAADDIWNSTQALASSVRVVQVGESTSDIRF